jgi:hypothetical protein
MLKQSSLVLVGLLALGANSFGEPCESVSNPEIKNKIAECVGSQAGLDKLGIVLDDEVFCMTAPEWQFNEKWAQQKVQIYYQIIEEPKKPVGQQLMSALKKPTVDPRRIQFSKEETCYPDTVAFLEGRYSTATLKAACGTFYSVDDDSKSRKKNDLLTHVHLGKDAVACDKAIELEIAKRKQHDKKEIKVKQSEIDVLKAEKRALQAEDKLEKKREKLENAKRKLGTAHFDPKVNLQQKDKPFNAGAPATSESTPESSANKAAP